MPLAPTALEHLDVLIVGAGISGIGAGRYLRVEHPGRSVAILEAREASGGTWDLFRYPGIRSDSDLHTFGYAFKPWRDRDAIAVGAQDPRLPARDGHRERPGRAHPLLLQGRAGRLVVRGRPLAGHRRAHRHR